MRRPSREVLIGDYAILESIVGDNDYRVLPNKPHPSDLEKEIVEIVSEMDEEMQEVFFLRFGERLSYRKIARILGFKSHWPIQVRVKNLIEEVKEKLVYEE